MAQRRELDQWLHDSEWVADFDFDVSRDAMRCRPDPEPYHRLAAPLALLPSLAAPPVAALPTRRMPAALPQMGATANSVWAQMGRAYEELGDTISRTV